MNIPFVDIHSHKCAVDKDVLTIRNISITAPNVSFKDMEYSSYFSIGIHPWNIPADIHSLLEDHKDIIANSSCFAIGEIGLDKLADTDIGIQTKAFTRQMKLASEYGLPVIIHCVKAWNELIEIHQRVQANIPCIIHGFRGKPELAQQLLKHGFYLSFGFRFNTESLKLCPENRIFLETDEQIRPIKELYETVAKIRLCDVEQLKTSCFHNFRNLNKK